MLKVSFAAVAVLGLVACSPSPSSPVVEPTPTTTPTAKPTVNAVVNSSEKDDAELGNYILLQMKIVKAQMSPLKKQILAKQIVSAANDIFTTQEHKKQFVTLIAIESKFHIDAKSGAGAVGLTQVITRYAPEFAAKCGVDNIEPGDLEVPEINLLVGGCRFRTLLEVLNGQTSVALVAYNAGLHSDQIKQLQELRSIDNKETANYIGKFFFIKEKADIQAKDAKNAKDKSEE
jgi:hypothetical protein